MNESKLTLKTSDGVALAARLHAGDPSSGAVICHPHPLYGGDMHNNVVLAARDALADLGLTTLRFDFRGAGGSEGAHDGGRGEQLDVAAAWAALARRAEPRPGVHLVAYSFGAWVAARALARSDLELSPETVTLISPPCSFPTLDFGGVPLPEVPTRIVVGDADQFCSLDDLDDWLGGAQVTRRLLAGVDHFYWGAEEMLKAAILELY